MKIREIIRPRPAMLLLAVAHLKGEPYDKTLDTGVFLATSENMNDLTIKKLLAPDLSILD